MGVQVHQRADEGVIADDSVVLAQELAKRAGRVIGVAVLVQDDEPCQFGQAGAEQFASAGGEDGAQILGVLGDHQLDVLQAHAGFAAEQLVDRVRREHEALGLAVAEGDVQTGEEFATAGDLGGHRRFAAYEGGAAGVGEPDQDVDESAHRQQAVFVGDVVAVVCGTVAEAADVVQCVHHGAAADVRLAALD
jgi:hypothetical protein